MIRAFLFDIGNVLLKFDFSVALRKLAEKGEVDNAVEVMARVDQIKLAYEDGQMDRAAFLRGAFDVLRYRGTEAEFVAAWEDIFTPNEPMVALVEKLHGRIWAESSPGSGASFFVDLPNESPAGAKESI